MRRHADFEGPFIVGEASLPSLPQWLRAKIPGKFRNSGETMTNFHDATLSGRPAFRKRTPGVKFSINSTSDRFLPADLPDRFEKLLLSEDSRVFRNDIR